MTERKRKRPTLKQVRELKADISELEISSNLHYENARKFEKALNKSDELLSQTIEERNDSKSAFKYWKDQHDEQKEIADQYLDLSLRVSMYNNNPWWKKMFTFSI